MTQVTIKSLIVRGPDRPSTCTLVPVDPKDTRQVPIEIGGYEAAAIAEGIEGARIDERPLSHDVTLELIEALNGQLSSIHIVKTEGPIFFAEIHIMNYLGSMSVIDARPSDAMALAVRAHIPIFMEDSVLDSASLPDFSAAAESAKQENLDQFHKFIEDISPDDF